MAALKLSASQDSDYFGSDDLDFLEALKDAKLPGDLSENSQQSNNAEPDDELALPPGTQPRYYEPKLPPSTQPRLLTKGDYATSLKRPHSPDKEVQRPEDDIYGEARFGEFGEYAKRKRAKLQIQNVGNVEDEMESVPQVFKGIAVYATGHLVPSSLELRPLIVRHGGQWHSYLDKKGLVTHIITAGITPAKVQEFKHMKVVLPAWLVESAKRGTLLPWQDYVYRPHRSENISGKQGLQQTLPNGFVASTPSASKIPSKPPISTNITNTKPPQETPRYAADKSNPNAQRVMKNADWRNAHTSVASDFIEGYYKNSRLHHLSTWKAELKSLLKEAQERAENADGSSGEAGKVHAEDEDGTTNGVSMRDAEFVLRSPTKSGKEKGKGKAISPGEEPVIMHCDFDSFFVAAGLVKRPELKGKPVVVCHSQGAQGGTSSTSEIASASYEARAFGVRNGMSLQQARKLCPQIITIPYEFEAYKQFSLKFYTILMTHADDLQAVSVDEALIDVTTTVERLRAKTRANHDPFSSDPPPADPAKEYAEFIRTEVRKATGCEISIGISHNILLARLATKRAKPAGSFHLLPKDVDTILHPLDISDLHGFGHSAKQKAMDKFGATKLGDLALKSKGVLCDALGKSTGETLYNAIRGVDDRKLENDKARKSVSCDINYGIRFETNEQVQTFIHQMATEVARRLNEIQMLGRSITLKVMKRDPTAPVEPPKFLGHGACHVFNKQMPLIGINGSVTAEPKAIGDHAWRLLKAFNFEPQELRGISIQIQKLEALSGDGSNEAGQGRLQFQKKPVPGRATGATDVEAKQLDETVEAPLIVHQNETAVLPSFSQVDKSVFEALPDDIRKELEGEYKRRSESPFPAAAVGGPSALPPHVQFAAPRPLPGPSFPFPRRANPSTFNAKRITQQLAPNRRGAAGSPNKRNIFMKRPSLAAWKVPERELRKLDIDPEVFSMLPRNIQREQITAARLLKTLGTIPDKATQRVVLKPRKLDPGEVFILPPPKANHVQPPLLKQQGAGKGEKLYFHETDDVQRVLEAWVERHNRWPPNEKDIEFFGKWMTKSLEATDEGMTRAIAVMKWWLILIKRYWASYERGCDDIGPGREVGEAWWDAFRTVKGQMDVIAKKRFGGKLSIR